MNVFEHAVKAAIKKVVDVHFTNNARDRLNFVVIDLRCKVAEKSENSCSIRIFEPFLSFIQNN